MLIGNAKYKEEAALKNIHSARRHIVDDALLIHTFLRNISFHLFSVSC